MYPFRVFISYSFEDSELAQKASDILTELGYLPLWARDISPGKPFTEVIKGFIHYAHLFMPLITRSSAQRPWVHQETGYAMALNLPILPVAIDDVPGQMISGLKAVVARRDLSDFRDILAAIDLEELVDACQGQTFTNVEVSDWAERRAELLARNARRVIEMNAYGRVRQRASLSSFSIPDKDPSNPIFRKRDGLAPRSPYYHHLLREERRALEEHARAAGCDLIVDPDFCLERNGPEATQTRLRILLEFLRSMPDDKLRVALSPRARDGNLTLVGDWFSAESVSPRPGEGHRQTIFTWHAPTVLQCVRRFDEEFADLERETGSSRAAAIAKVEAVLAR